MKFSVPGSESRHRVVVLLRCLGPDGELPETPPFRDAFLKIIHKTRERFHLYTERNATNEQQTLLPGHAGADQHCGNDGEQCCHLASQHGYSPFLSGLPATARRPLEWVSFGSRG